MKLSIGSSPGSSRHVSRPVGHPYAGILSAGVSSIWSPKL